MTKRLSAGVVLAVFSVIFTAMNAYATHPPVSEWRSGVDPYSKLFPQLLRSAPSTTWVNIGQGTACAGDSGVNHGVNQVWCFDGDDAEPSRGGDSTWAPAGQGTGNWDHWSKYLPPNGAPSKWHVSTIDIGPAQGDSFSAWCGCDENEVPAHAACDDLAFWVFKKGYGDDWNYSLELSAEGSDASGGGTVEFDIMYDTECNYDYIYLEYYNTVPAVDTWAFLQDSGLPVWFNAVSGNLEGGGPPAARSCGNDYFNHSDQKLISGNLVNYYGNAIWLEDVSFPLPTGLTEGLRLRWRAYSDPAWSDLDGNGDTDGMCHIDNVTVTLTASGEVISDDFESGDFDELASSTASGAFWFTAPAGNPVDNFHLVANPLYKNQGNTCTFSNDWMWSVRPAAGFPNGFNFLAASPVIDCNNWNGAVVQYADYLCALEERKDYAGREVRTYNSTAGAWGAWQALGYNFGGCEFWGMDRNIDLGEYMGPEIDSLQVSWNFVEYDVPGTNTWNKHGSVDYFFDNVSIGRLATSASTFSANGFSDTYSLCEPAHSSTLQSREEGLWDGQVGGTREFASNDSLDVDITDVQGIKVDGTGPLVSLHFRVGTGTPPVFGSWGSKRMVFSVPDPQSPSNEGTYRSTFGAITGAEDFAPLLEGGGGAPDTIFLPGSTCEYYVSAVDSTNETSYLPAAVVDTPAIYLRFQVHPFYRVTPDSAKILVVDDYRRDQIDVENSSGFVPNGGIGFGDFTTPVFDLPLDMVQAALIAIYGGAEDYEAGVYGAARWDIFNVGGAGSTISREPRVIGDYDRGLGGLTNDLATVVNYDAVIWLNGSFDAFSIQDTTRLELKAFLDNGGKLFSSGDDVAMWLGTGGANADSAVQFLGPYMGISFTAGSQDDDDTLDRVLNVEGEAGTSLAGLKMGLYGECPSVRHAFDKINLYTASDPGNDWTNSILARYSGASPDDETNGRAAIIKNVRDQSGGVCVHAAFAIECLNSTAARACLLSKILGTDFGLTAPFAGCVQSGTDSPVIAGRFGFDLAQASPNPFRDATSIRFSVPGRTHVSIEVFNILGQKVRTLVDETLDGNSYVRKWDGHADGGAVVSSGIYFYKMVAGDYTATRKAVVLK